MQLVNRRNLVIAGSIVLLLILVGGLYLAQQARDNANKQQATTEGTDTQTVDKNSGETVSNIEGKTPETYGMLPNTPAYLNTEEFITNGLTSEQLDSLKYAFYMYTTAQNPKITQVSITKDSVTATPPNADGKMVANFQVAFDGKAKVPASIVYFENSVELTIMDASGNKVFESGTVTDKSVYTQP